MKSALLDVVMRVVFRAINIICFDRNTSFENPNQNIRLLGYGKL